MDRWVQALSDAVDVLLKHPADPLEKGVLLAAGVLFFLWVHARTGRAFGFAYAGGFRGGGAAALGLALVLAALAGASLYWPQAGPWLWAGVPAAVSLALVVPLLCAMQRANYVTALAAWLISAAALAAMVLMLSAAFAAFRSGSGQADKARAHRQELEQVIDGR
jgi:hypothetical protein